MKRIASIFVLSIFLFNIIGYYVLFSLLNLENKEEMGLVLQNGTSLETIRIHKSELANIVFKDGDKEISIKGEMYDVKTTSTEGDYIVFHCLKDKKETKLLTALDKEVNYNSNSNPASEKKPNDSHKNPVKDLFFNTNNSLLSFSIPHAFKSHIVHCTSCIASAPSLPPEVSIA